MTTESDAVLATIVDNWGGGGYGGATPAFHSTTDISVDRWAALDSVTVLHDTLDELHPPVNDKFVNKEYTMDIRVTSITTEDQLKLLVEEVEYLLNNTEITGFTDVRVYRKFRGSSDRGRKVYRNDITIKFGTKMSSSAVAPSGGTGTGLTGAYIEDALMWGSANAAWIPCHYMGYKSDALAATSQSMYYPTAVGAKYNAYLLPLPTTKGSLKLYVGDVKIDGNTGFDATNKIDNLLIYGYTMSTSTSTAIFSDATDKTTNAIHTWSNTADDASSYDYVYIYVNTANAGTTLRMSPPLLSCYYAA